MIGAIENERSRLINRQSARAGGGVWNLSGVQREGFESELAVWHMRLSSTLVAEEFNEIQQPA